MSSHHHVKVERWLERSRGDRRAALVLGASVNGLSFVRSLERRGVPTLLLDTQARTGAYTRLGQVLTLPPETDDAAFLDRIERIVEQLPRRGVLFATSDATNELVARCAEILAKHLDFIVPPADLIRRIIDKRTQYPAAAAAGIPIPRTYFPASAADLHAVARELEFPCILKPYVSHRRPIRRKVIEIGSACELLESYRQHEGPGVHYMVQEIVPGGDDALFGYLGFWDAAGRERAWLTKRKLRPYPPGFGDGSYQESVTCEEVADQARDLLSTLGYRGLVGVEFKRDPRDGVFRLMEINPRTVSGNQLAVSAGVDFPWIAYRHLCGLRIDTPRFRPGVRHVNEEWDLKAFLLLRRHGTLGTRAWIRSLLTTDSFALGARGDWRPLLVAFYRLVKGFAGGRKLQ